MKKILLLFVMSALIFTGCDNNDVNVERDIVQKPTEQEFLQAIEEWEESELIGVQIVEDEQFKDARTAATSFTLTNYYSDYGAFFLSGHLNRTECVSSSYTIYVDYWLYNYSERKWTKWQAKYGQCMEGDNLNTVSGHYSHSVNGDCYVFLMANVYYRKNSTNELVRNYRVYSNATFLDWPF